MPVVENEAESEAVHSYIPSHPTAPSREISDSESDQLLSRNPPTYYGTHRKEGVLSRSNIN